jgi:hypothetical protein
LSDSDVNITKTLTKVTYLGLLWNVLFPVAFVGVAIYIRQGKEIDEATGGLSIAPHLKILFYILLAVSAGEFAYAYYLRRKLPTYIFRLKRQQHTITALSLEEHFDRVAKSVTSIIVFFVSGPCFYGLVLLLMGAQIEVMVLFVALSLIGYQLFRPREAFLERVLERVKQIRAEAGQSG